MLVIRKLVLSLPIEGGSIVTFTCLSLWTQAIIPSSLNMSASRVVTHPWGQRYPRQVARQVISVQVVVRDPPKVQEVKDVTLLKTWRVAVVGILWCMYFLISIRLVLLARLPTNILCLPLTILRPPPVTVWCIILVWLKEQFVNIWNIRTIRLRHITYLQAICKTGLNSGRVHPI